MAPDFKTFLATEIVSEGKTLSYRNVSRALKVHVNAAKCMLYEFYEKENKKKPGSLYATYLIAGKKKVINLATGDNDHVETTSGDVLMPSSPPGIPSSLPNASQRTEQLEERYQVPVKSISLCREESLEQVKELYEQISSIHMYSLSPVRIQDLATLSDTGRAVFADYHAKQDPLTHNKDYGLIQNPHVWRRKGKRPTNFDVEVPQPKLQSKAPAKEEITKPFGKTDSKPDSKKESTPAVASRPSSRDSTTTQESSKAKPNLKRDGSSLFKAFAKQSAKPKLERKGTDASDSKMSGMDTNDDEGESEDEAMFLDTGTATNKKRPGEVQREKEERQAKLRKMMEDDAEEETAVPKVEDAADLNAEPPAAKENEDPDAPAGDDEDVDWSDSDTEKKSKVKTESKPDDGPKRRRGKRKVMKKKTMQDEEGFLVTREEEAWESFSEDEPEPKPQAKKPAFPAKSSAPAKSQSQTQKGSAAKSSAGVAGGKKKDIMSFFGKK